MVTAVYGASPVKRERSTRAQLEALRDAIVDAVATESPITLRGVFYRVVSAGAVEKTELGYRKVGRELIKLRREGVIAYDAITDGSRWTFRPGTWSSLDARLRAAASSYRRALWTDSPHEVQIYSEKDAITSVIADTADEWDVVLGIVRGYSSETFCYQVAKSILSAENRGKDSIWIYQVGDHDPSGLDAWRAFTDRVIGFMYNHISEYERSGSTTWIQLGDGPVVEFTRLAVTPEQITQHQLPTRPTKSTDTRAAGFAGGSVEVDALPPTVLREIVRDAITQHIDQEALRLTRMAEQNERELLERIARFPWQDSDKP